ncbi:MAG TPA: multicopper oxidase family protein [Gaiellaceae bacterium]|nr:multicopper oxidase family protein [Gaiellaceae bacterium]
MKKHLGTALTTVAMIAGVALLGFLAWSWWQSRLPGRYDVMSYGAVDQGGAQPIAHHHFGVDSLTGPKGKPDYRVTLTAEKAPVRLSSGQEVDAWTFDGSAPGPELRVRKGELVQVTLVNKDIDDGVTIHWHGLDVPNAEDGVAGVTQNAVEPGGRYVYRFRPEQVGTFWYHTHQDASEGVKEGLFGALVVEAKSQRPGLDLALPVHTFAGHTAIGTHDDVARRAVRPGTPVRLRLINTDSASARFQLSGMRPAVVAIDGAEIPPARIPAGEPIEIGGGGRYDVAFVMPNGVASVEIENSKAALVLSPDGTGEPSEAPSGPVFDPATRGQPTPLLHGAHFDRTFDLTISKKPGFLDGRPGRHWALNGKLYPRVPMFEVAKGDLVRINLDNDSSSVHPMHLHGHHFDVLTRDGKAVSPWSTDTLLMLPHERYSVAFRANNPGLWMLHCHNLGHAADGLTMHLMYAGVTTPFRAGKSANNDPE